MSVPIKVKKSSTTTLTVEHELALTNEELVVILQDAGYQIPQACEVFVVVPGGGNWSNTDLSIDARTPLRVTWKTVKQEKSDG